MGRRQRMYLPGIVYEVTSRTLGCRYALRPSAASDALILGVFGRAQHLYPTVRIHALNPLSTHTTELLSSDNPEELERFIGFVKGNISKELKRLHSLQLPVFGGRRASVIPIAPDRESLEARLSYVLSQGTKEDLVASPRDWDGITGVHALEHGKALEGVWFDRTAESQARRNQEQVDPYDFATRYTVTLSPLPCWDDSNDDWRQRVTAIVDNIEERARERRALDGVTVLGMTKVRAFPPTYTPPAVKRSPAPLVLAATKNAFDALKRVYRSFCEAFQEASTLSRNGGGESVSFPPFSFPPGRPMILGGMEDFRLHLGLDAAVRLQPG